MLNQYGFEGPQWELAKQQAKDILIEVARRRGRIAYSELVPQIAALQLESHDPRLFHLLGLACSRSSCCPIRSKQPISPNALRQTNHLSDQVLGGL